MKCPKCGANNPETAEVCLRCGTALKDGVPSKNNGESTFQLLEEPEENEAVHGNETVEKNNILENSPIDLQGNTSVTPSVNTQPINIQSPVQNVEPVTLQESSPSVSINQEKPIESPKPPIAQPTTQESVNQNIANLYANTPVANKNSKEIDQKGAVGIYIGEQANKIQSGNNFLAGILGSIWFFYRKLYVHGAIFLVLEILCYMLSRGLGIPIVLFLILRFLFLFFAANIFYVNKTIKTVEKLQFQYDNSDMSEEEYRKILTTNGGVNLVYGALGVLALAGGVFLSSLIIPEKYVFHFEIATVKAKGWTKKSDSIIQFQNTNGTCFVEEYLLKEKTEEDFKREYEIGEDSEKDISSVTIGKQIYKSYEIDANGNKYRVIEVNQGEKIKAYFLAYGSKNEEYDFCLKEAESDVIDHLEIK